MAGKSKSRSGTRPARGKSKKSAAAQKKANSQFHAIILFFVGIVWQRQGLGCNPSGIIRPVWAGSRISRDTADLCCSPYGTGEALERPGMVMQRIAAGFLRLFASIH